MSKSNRGTAQPTPAETPAETPQETPQETPAETPADLAPAIEVSTNIELSDNTDKPAEPEAADVEEENIDLGGGIVHTIRK